MHVGKLMARLNPKNVRFDVDSGGIPELTPQDIAAALGMVEDGIGREMLCQVWWPDGAKLTEDHLFEVMADAQRQEWQRREDAMLTAVLAVAERGDKARGIYASAHANRWPRMVHVKTEIPFAAPGYQKVTRAVLREMKGAGICQNCHGRTIVFASDAPVKVCPSCLGSGHQAVSSRARAEACGIEWKSFHDDWQRVYEWTAELCSQSLLRAHRQFIAAIGGC
ncbi:hypothetical protein SAMN04487785_1144 [Dyella jiangningensis]|nr:hypothetical protein BDW41_113169 [Dyella sp. AtDHG13]SDL03695.1 hypothetical protein SAMN04487785_1144 [Dyella jiangningensis]